MMISKDTFHQDIRENVVKTWKGFICSMEESLDTLEKGLTEAEEMRDICTAEWCEATEHVIDELSNSLFSISEPSWSSDEDSKRIKSLKRKVHDLYAKYRATADTEKTDEAKPYCTTAPSAEHARAQDEDEPCDDSRGG